MNLILVQPPLPANERHKKVLPLGLAYLASYLRRGIPGLPIAIVDGQVRNMPVDVLADSVLRFSGERTAIGITYWTCQAPAAFELSRRLRAQNPRAVIIHGGIHATIFPEESLAYADYCVLHEGEESLRELLQCLMNEPAGLERVRGIACHSDGALRIHPARPFIEDLDSLPLPAWDLLELTAYDSPLHVVGGRRLPIIGSRGCPYGCTYCGSPLMWGRRVRWRSPENVIAEMKESIERLGIAQFHFWDDNLMLNRAYIEKLCRLLVDNKLSVRWTGLTRASHIAASADLMPLLRDAGCIGLEVGIESANPDTFRAIKKDEDLQLIEDVARLHKANGMSPLFTFMAFNPGETIAGYYEQARFIDRLISDLPWYDHFHMMPFPIYVGQFCTAYPGTKLYEEAPALGEVLARGWGDYYHHRINFVPRSLLDDVPARNLGALGPLHYRLCNFVLQVALWDVFNEGRPLEDRRAAATRYRDFLAAFWRHCNGRRSVRDICEEAGRRCGVSREEGLAFGALTCLVLGQTGVIVSAIHDRGRRRGIISVAKLEQIPIMVEPYPPGKRASVLAPALALLDAMGRAFTGRRFRQGNSSARRRASGAA